MAAFSITADTNFHSLTGRSGNDSYTIAAGATLTIDSDVRYGPNVTTTTGPFGNISATAKGARLLIDSRNVRAIPYSGGSGTVPAAGTTISQGGVTGKLIGVWSTGYSVQSAGSAMPASGIIKIRQKAGGNFAAGALTGISATASGADSTGWIEVVGVDGSTLSASNGLSSIEMQGDLFVCATATGSAQTVVAPVRTTGTRYPGAYVETAVGSGVYEFWPNASPTTAIATDGRGKFCFCDNLGNIVFGLSGVTAAGAAPAAGCKIAVPSIFFASTNGTIGYGSNKDQTDTTKVSFSNCPGSLTINRVAAPGLNFQNVTPISLTITESAFHEFCRYDYESITANTVATFTRVGIGTRHVNPGGSSIGHMKGVGTITMTGCHFSCYKTSGYGRGFYFEGVPGAIVNGSTFSNVIRDSSGSYDFVLSTEECSGWTINGITILGGRWDTPKNSQISAVKYAVRVGGAQDTIYTNAINLGENSRLDGLSWLVSTANACHPYGQLISARRGTEIRNIGTIAAPLDLGTTNASEYGIYGVTDPSDNRKIKRVYMKGARNRMIGNYNSVGGVFQDFGSSSAGFNAGDLTGMATQYLGVLLPSTTSDADLNYYESRPGVLVIAAFGADSTTSARIYLLPRATTATTAQYLTLSNAQSDGLTTLYVSAGGYAEWTTPWIVGHTGFQNTTQLPQINGNFSVQYDLDKGSGFSGTWKTASGANMSAEASIDASVGFRLKVRATNSTGSEQTISGCLALRTTTTASAMANQYPLDPNLVTVNGLVAGSVIKARRVDTGALLFTASESGGVVSQTINYTGQIEIEARRASSTPYYQPWTAVATVTGDTTITALQVRDDQ